MRLFKPVQLVLLSAFLSMALFSMARAELVIDVTGGSEGGIPIAIIPFVTKNATAPTDLAKIISADLGRSGLFDPFPVSDMPQRPSRPEEINFDAWRILGVTNVIGGSITAKPTGTFDVQVFAYDVFKRNAGKRFVTKFEVKPHQLRGLAHHIADKFYEAVTGYRGTFQTRIMYVEVSKKDGKRWYELVVADADGYNPKTVFSDSEPVMSPTWSPDGKMISFVSFAAGRPQIYVQDMSNGKRHVAANYKGANQAPSWSPDGRWLAMALSKDGNFEIYKYDLYKGKLHRLTNNRGIDTEPSWSPDSKSIVFTSNRGGNPHIYQMDANGGNVRRLTFKGNYNARPRFSPNGNTVTFIHSGGNGYQIAVMDIRAKEVKVLSEGPSDESPSFAPNGRMILYAGKQGRRGILYAISVDGRERYPLAKSGADIREPAWSPYMN